MTYGYDNPAPGTRLWRLRTYPETLTLEDAVTLAAKLDARLRTATPAADPRLASIVKQHQPYRRYGEPTDGCVTCSGLSYVPWPCDVAVVLALLPARTATTEAEALAALPKDEFWFVSHQVEPDRTYWHIGIGTMTVNYPDTYTLPDAIAAALAASEGKRPAWTEPQSVPPVRGGRA